MKRDLFYLSRTVKGRLTEETRYYLRHQVDHLERANRANDIHRLLAARTPDKQNAWYKAKQTIGDTNGYLDDINRAWRICEHDSLQGGDKNQIATNIGLHIRYALIRSSIVGLIASMPPSWLWALVDKGVWSPSEAVRYTARMPRSETKAIALSRLAPALPLPELREALDVARHIRDIRHKEAALAGLAPRLAELGNTQEALDIVTKINWQENRRDALIGICSYLPSSLLMPSLQIARQLEYPGDRLLALSALARKMPLDARVEVCCEALDAASKTNNLLNSKLLVDGLVALSHSLPWDMVPILIKAVNSLIPYNKRSALALLSWEYWLQQKEKGVVLVSLVRRMVQLGKTGEAIQLTSQIKYQQWRSEAIVSLAVNLTPPLFHEVVELARGLQFEGDRARALTALAASVCCPTCRKHKLLEEALKAINQIDQNDEIKAYCILDIIPYLPQTLLSVVVHNARRINSEVWRKATFIALASVVPESDRDEALQNLPEDAIRHFSEFLIGGYCAFISAWRLPILSVHYLPDFHVWRAIKDCNKIFEYVKNHLRSQILQKTLLMLQSGKVQAPWGETDLRPFQIWGAREMLAPYLSRDLLEQALKTLSISEDDDWQAATIAAYFPHLPKPLKLEMMFRSVAAVQAHDYELSYNDVRGHMAELAPLLPPTFIGNVDVGHSKYGWNSSWNEVPGWIVKRMAVSGFFKEALATIKKMDRVSLQVSSIVEAMGHFPISLLPQTLALVRDQNGAGQLLSQIVDAAEEPLLDEAIIIAYEFEDAGKRGELLAAIALRLVKLGQTRRALETVKKIDYEWYRSEALVNIVEYLPSSMMKCALHMALSLHFDYDRLRALTSIACHASEITQKDALDEAIKMICETCFEPFSWVVPGSLIKLCGYLNEDHVYRILTSFTHSKKNFVSREEAEAIGCLVYRLAELGHEDEALEIACGFSMQIYKREAFSRLGARSERFLLKGLEVAKEFEAIDGSWTDKWILIVNLAPHMSETNIDKALHLLEETRDGGQTIFTDLSALSALLLRLTELGYVDRALEITESYLSPEFRGKALVTLAKRLTQSFVPTAFRIARTVPITPDRINALAAISIQAEEPLRQTALEEALDTATTIAYGLFDSQAFWAYGTGAPWADSLKKLLPLLPEDLLQRAWSMLKDVELINYETRGIEGIDYDLRIPSSINIILSALTQRPISISFPYLSEILQVASNRLRSDMLRHIPAMVDFIIHVGGEKAAEEVVRAVQEVCSQKWLS